MRMRAWVMAVAVCGVLGSAEIAVAEAEPGPSTALSILERAKDLIPDPFLKTWEMPTATVPWTPRATPGSTVLGDTLWIYGGDSDEYQNDVWYTRNGRSWTRALANATWTPRSELGSAAYQGHMWVLGGLDGALLNDVYKSSDGINWTQVTKNAAWSGRGGHATLVYKNLMWVLGGTSTEWLNDVWYSADGAEWIRATANAAWAKRGDPAAVVFDNKMWIIGGTITNSRFRDVWSSEDGTVWTEATASAPWAARYGHSVTAYNNQLWLAGGSPAGKDLWYSDDGANWYEGEAPSWIARRDHTAHAFANKLYVLGGWIETNAYTNEVWTYEPGSGFGCVAGKSQQRAGGSFGDLFVFFGVVLLLAGTRAARRTRSMVSPTTLRRTILVLALIGGAALPARAATDPVPPATGTMWTCIKEILPDMPMPKAWDVVAELPPWEARVNHGSVLHDGKMWIFGGSKLAYFNDVWHTPNGRTWTQAVANAVWTPRVNFGTVSFQDKIWVLGGLDATVEHNDVYSSTDGVNWTEVTPNAAWAGRSSHSVVVYNNLMWVLGGRTGTTFNNDVWYSADGKEWIRAVANAAWGKRAGGAAVVFNNRMWMLGGNEDTTYYRDAWHSVDGSSWTLATATAPWSARTNHAVTEYNGRLWLTGGFLALKDVWTSEDGLNWIPGEMPGWDGRDGHTSHVFDDKLYILGGHTQPNGDPTNEVWTHAAGSGVGCGAGNGAQRAGMPLGDLLALAVVVLVLLAFGRLRWARRWSATLLVAAFAVLPGSTWADDQTGAAATRLIWERVKYLLPDPSFLKSWQLTPEVAPWEARSGPGSVVLGDTMWIYGGSGAGELNDVWSTTNGTTWTQAVEHAAWTPRDRPGSVAFNDKMWLLGGIAGPLLLNDVHSSSDGVNWTQVTAKAAWSARVYHSAVVFDDLIWIMGGYTGSDYSNDVWYSAGGRDWTRATAAAAWGKRGNAALVAFQGKMWLCGGFSGVTQLRDVWSSDDGITWSEATASAPWSGRSLHTVTVFNDRLWLIGGGPLPGSKEVWYSDDGINWFPGEAPQWDGRDGHATHAFRNKLYVLGGYISLGTYTNEVWTYSAGSAMGCGGRHASQRAGIPKGDVLALSLVLLVLGATWRAARRRAHVNSMAVALLIVAGATAFAEAEPSVPANRVVWESAQQFIPGLSSLKEWASPAGTVPWPARSTFGSVVLDNKMWIFGGRREDNAAGSPTYFNDVWYSEDGSTWTRVIEHAAWSERLAFGAVNFQNKMWVLGGLDNSDDLNDVHSSSDGVNWTEVTASAAWSDRIFHKVIVHDGKMWVLGGYGNAYLNDVWHSSDGKSWNLATANAAWSARGNFAAVTFKNKMWVLGGFNGTARLRDIWSSNDGVVWDQETTSAPWGARHFLSVVGFNGQLWLTGGGEPPQSKQAWYSDDGVNWFESETPPWSGRLGHESLAFANNLYVLGGYVGSGVYSNEVWTYDTPAAMGCGAGTSGQQAGVPFGDLCALAVVAIVLLAFGKLRRARQCVPTLLLGVLFVVHDFSWADAAPDATGTRVILERVKELLPVPIGAKVWEMPAEITPWAGRAAHGTVVLGNRMWIYGGLNPTELNDVWYTQDGTTWTRAIASAAWSPRYDFGAAAFQNKMWVMGGYDATGGRNDVYSSSDGVNWAQVTTDAAWSKRYRHTSLAHDGKLWVFGGYSQGSAFNDVWSSTDGKEWTRAIENAEWADRSGLESASFKNKLWVFGGSYLNTYFRDIWYSDDGITWTEATATAPWSGRDTFSVAVYNGRLWLSGGHPGIKDLWYSDDGINWFEGELPEWDGRFNHSSHAFANKLFVLGGYTESNGYTNEVWSYESASGMGCSAGTSRPRRAVPFGDTILVTSAVLLLAVYSKRTRSTPPRHNVELD